MPSRGRAIRRMKSGSLNDSGARLSLGDTTCRSAMVEELAFDGEQRPTIDSNLNRCQLHRRTSRIVCRARPTSSLRRSSACLARTTPTTTCRASNTRGPQGEDSCHEVLLRCSNLILSTSELLARAAVQLLLPERHSTTAGRLCNPHPRLPFRTFLLRIGLCSLGLLDSLGAGQLLQPSTVSDLALLRPSPTFGASIVVASESPRIAT